MQLFYRQFGSGNKHLLILHGLLGVSDNWVSFAKDLSPQWNVLIPDLRNHGQSPHSEFHNYEAMGEDVIELLDDLRIEEVYIIGHSMGGKLAMKLALLNPERIKMIVVVDVSPRSYSHSNEHHILMEAMLSLNFDTICTRQEAEHWLSEKIPNKRILLFVTKNLYWISPKRLAWRLNLPALLDCLPNIYEEISYGSPSKIPALFIKGGNSPYVSESDLPLIEKLFSNFEVHTIPNAGHWVHADAKEELLRMVTGFLE